MGAGGLTTGRRRRAAVRILVVLGALFTAGAVWFVTAPAASAHALVVSSDPSAGQSLTQLPKAVTITFSERVLPNLSDIEVVDSSGRVVTPQTAHAVPGNPLQLAVPLPTLLGGVYTVRWSAVSPDDGHHTSGQFRFSVGPLAFAAMSGPAPELVSTPSAASPAIVAGYWMFDAGIGLLVGGCWIAGYGYPRGGRRPLFLALGGAAVLLLGLAVNSWAQAASDHITLDELASTSLGLGLAAQALPALAAAQCVAWAMRTEKTGRRSIAAATVLAAVAIAAHVLTTHAATGPHARLELVSQWAHIAAFAVWIGGLAALLTVLGGEPDPAKTAAVRRFSKVAGYSLGVLVLTGVLRTLDEIGAWESLGETLFGRLILIKLALAAALTGLGAYSRYRSVPAIGAGLRGLRSLRRTGTAEVGIAALALVAASTLASELPPALLAAVAAPRPVPHITVTGTAPGVHASLDISPGYPGPNRFTLRAYDAAGRAVSLPLTAPATLTFRLPARPEVAADSLTLTTTADGSLTAIGNELALTGSWHVTADLKLSAGNSEVPFTVACALSPSQIEQMTMGRMVMLYGIRLAGGRQLEAYLTPARPGKNTLHVLFTDQRNAAISMSGPPTVTVHRDGSTATRTFSLREVVPWPITRNNYFGDMTFTQGRWDFHLTATAADGTQLSTDFALTIS